LKLAHEKETLGFYITGHPLRRYLTEISAYANVTTSKLLDKAGGSEIAIGGVIAQTRATRTKKGNRMGFVILEDLEGVVEVLVFPDTFEKTHEVLVPDAPVIVVGKLDEDETTTRILASNILPIDRAHELLSTTVTVAIDALSAPPDLPQRLLPMIEKKSGQAEIVFEIHYPNQYTAFVRPNPYLKVLPDSEFVAFVEGICGPDTVKCSK
jgi:DNA polymerase-3 subunit alpha